MYIDVCIYISPGRWCITVASQVRTTLGKSVGGTRRSHSNQHGPTSEQQHNTGGGKTEAKNATTREEKNHWEPFPIPKMGTGQSWKHKVFEGKLSQPGTFFLNWNGCSCLFKLRWLVLFENAKSAAGNAPPSLSCIGTPALLLTVSGLLFIFKEHLPFLPINIECASQASDGLPTRQVSTNNCWLLPEFSSKPFCRSLKIFGSPDYYEA